MQSQFIKPVDAKKKSTRLIEAKSKEPIEVKPKKTKASIKLRNVTQSKAQEKKHAQKYLEKCFCKNLRFFELQNISDIDKCCKEGKA